NRSDERVPAPLDEVVIRVLEDAHEESDSRGQMLSLAAPAGLRERMNSNSVLDTKTAVNTLAIKPKNNVVANPRMGPVRNWKRNAAGRGDETWVSTIAHHPRSKPAATA